MEKCSIAELYV